VHAPRFRRPSPAMIVGLLALTIALGGVSYAATSLPRRSDGAKQLRHGAVTRSKLHKGAVTSVAVRNRTLRRRDFKVGQIPQGPRGLQGPTGLQGLQGEQGTPGTPGTPASQEWGWIRGDATIGASQGVTKAVRDDTGKYTVTFDRPVAQACAPVVTPNSTAALKATWVYGVDPTITVFLFNAANAAVDNNFSIVLACPPQ
jgi:hypothetical protein